MSQFMEKWIFVFLFLITFSSYSCELDVRLEQNPSESNKKIKNEWFDIDIELTETLLSEIKCDFNVVKTPWARALLMLASGDIDLLSNVSKTREREKLYYFIGPIHSEEIIFATYEKLHYNLTKMEDLLTLEKPIAIQQKAYYGEAMQQLIENEKYQDFFIVVANNETKLRLLKRGRISGFLEAKRYIIHGIENNASYKDLWFPDLIIHKNPIYFALSKHSINEELKNKISDAFERLTAKGKINKIVLKHKKQYLPL